MTLSDIGKQTQCTIKAGFSAAVWPCNNVQASQRDNYVPQGAVIGNCKNVEHENCGARSYAANRSRCARTLKQAVKQKKTGESSDSPLSQSALLPSSTDITRMNTSRMKSAEAAGRVCRCGKASVSSAADTMRPRCGRMGCIRADRASAKTWSINGTRFHAGPQAATINRIRMECGKAVTVSSELIPRRCR